ncbi:MAG: hypothetical protein KAJ97_00925 [Acidobacteria bacterium]|nr:hypothetical protein [Acidobacteriota bacterium]
MIQRGLITGLMTVLLAGAVPAGAQFLAADLIYLPVAAHTAGENNSNWRTDLFITNVEDTPVDVAIVYLPTGLASNSGVFFDRSTWLGGRESDGFGFVDPALADIPPHGTVVLRDPVGEYWVSELNVDSAGAMVLFAYEAGSLQEDGTRIFKNVILNSRIFNQTTIWEPDPENEGEFLEVDATYGQGMPGVPWYSLVSSSAVSEDGNFSFQILTGANENRDFRYNLGVVNASDPLTTITVAIQPFQGNGEPFLDVSDQPMFQTVILPPASHVQYNSVLRTLFGLASVPDDVRINVSFVAWESGGDTANPGFACYGSLVDNRSNDPTTILPSFGFPYDVDCMWGPDGGGEAAKSGSAARQGRRPLEIPSR